MSQNEYNEYEWVDNELPKVREFFDKIAVILNKFAQDHNLIIEKYYHYIPGWEFLFRHPEGGKCYLEVLKSNDNHVTLMAAMWIDEYDSCLSYNKHTDKILCSLDKKELTSKLDELLGDILSWKKEDMERITTKPSTMTRKEFKKDLERYPVPKIRPKS